MLKKDLKRYSALPYRFECHFDPDDEVWVVRYPELQGCVAHGATVQEALKRAESFKLEWIEAALESGDPVPEPKMQEYSGKLVLRLPKDLHEKIAGNAAHEDISLNAYIVQAVAEKAERTGLKILVGNLLESVQRNIPVGEFTWGNEGKKVSPESLAEMPLIQSPAANGK
jgi:predicted RNase H-like HicB family nuclease